MSDTIAERMEKLRAEHEAKLAALPDDVRQLVRREVRIQTIAVTVEKKASQTHEDAVKTAQDIVFGGALEIEADNRQAERAAR